MVIGIGSDHHGIKQKEKITKFLTKKGHKVVDFGVPNSEMSDFPPIAFEVSENVINKKVDLGILICYTGIGMSIAANKVKGIRCAKLDSFHDAKYAKRDNNANVVNVSSEKRFAKYIINRFIKSKFSPIERYQKRNDMIAKYEDTREY